MFDASASVGANGEQLVYSWDFGNDKKGQANKIAHLYNTEGSYIVTLTVAGNYGATHTITKTVAIGSGPIPSTYTGVVKGYITDQNNTNLSGVTVSLIDGDGQAISDNFGMVLLSNLPVGVPLYFKITKTGYVKQIVRLTLPSDTVQGLFYATLKSRAATITFSNVEYGGEIKGGDGATIELPVDGLVKPDGMVATGSVSVSVTPIDVVYNTNAFPGTFNALRSNGDTSVLLSLGVMEFNFEQGGKQLQIASGKTAGIDIPIYTSGAKIGDQIPLWSINESNGLWVEEGIGTVIASTNSPTGLAMKAEIGHLSWWNCDDFDNDHKRDVLCWRWECTTAQCYRVKVGCWMSGALNDDGSPANSNSALKKTKTTNDQRDSIPPVFEVREFVSEEGSNLIFPANKDVYIEARAFIASGELLRGQYTVKASAPDDTVKIELISVDKGDTIDLPLNTTVQGDLNNKQLIHYRVTIPEQKLYSVTVEPGDNPLTSGIYIVKDDKGLFPQQNVNTKPQYIFTSSNQILITVSKTNEFATGNFNIGVYESDATPIALNDSISDSTTTVKNIFLYSIKSPKTNLVNYKYFKANNSANLMITVLSPRGIPLFTESMYSSEKQNSIVLAKDSFYYFELRGTTPGRFFLITQEDEQYHIAYGDTVTHRLKNLTDKDLCHFNGFQDDLVTIKGTQPKYTPRQGTFELISTDGRKIASRVINYTHTSNDYEIIYKLPSDGAYSILISNDTGNYQIILNKAPFQVLNYNKVNEIDVLPDDEYYLIFEAPENIITHLSATCDNNHGNMYLWSDNGTRLFYDTYGSLYQRQYVDILTDKTYYVKIENETASKVYINLVEPKLLTGFDSKGKIEFNDTIHGMNEVNVYHIKGLPGDGIHTILESIDKNVNPEKLKLGYKALSKKENYMNSTNYVLDYYSLDSTKLVEMGTTLTGATDETSWLLFAYAQSAGQYKLTLHYVKSTNDIIVDDDFVEYPAAATSSPIAAGYAITDGGSILLANGVYSSYLPITVNSKNVQFSGQTKENVLVQQTYNNLNVPALSFNSCGGILNNLTAENGPGTYQTIDANNDSITIENIAIMPLPGQSKVSGELKGRGKNIIIRNITHTNAGRGINLGGSTGLVENCTINADVAGIECAGNNMVVKNNTIQINITDRAIRVESGLGQGNHRVDSNLITINTTSHTTGYIISMIENGNSSTTNTSYISNNKIVSSCPSAAFSAVVGNPPSKLIIEGNTFKSSYNTGAIAMYVGLGRTDGGSSLIVRNNTFDGLVSKEAIFISGIDYINNGYRIALYNNNFRMAVNTTHNNNNNFIWVSRFGSSFTDTAKLYIVNNIFQGDGFSYLFKCQDNFSLYSDYNILYNFTDDIIGVGSLIGTTHDITSNPLYIDNDLHIDAGSPAINNGATPAQFYGIPEFDFNGVTRPKGAGYDIGAYEVE